MSEILAGDLSRWHIWCRVTLTVAGAEVSDTLRSVTHEAMVIDASTMTDEVPTLHMGRLTTRLSFVRFGTVEVPPNAPVRISA